MTFSNSRTLPVPIVTEYKVQRVLSNGNRPVRTSEEALHEEWNIFTAFAQRRQRNGYDIQSVIKVLSELARFDHVRDVLSRLSDQSEINANRLIAPKALDRLLLYHSQKLYLQGWTKITDLIEKNGSAICFFKTSNAPILRIGKSALLVAEQLFFQNSIGNSCAIDLDEGTAGPSAECVDGVSYKLLASSRFPEH